jgi:hypothetical protein
MTAPPVMSPSRNGGCSSESLSRFWVRPEVSTTMIEKIMVVAPTTAVPISTGLAVALKVLPAPSFSSSSSLAVLELHVEAEVLADLRGDVGDRFDHRQLVDRLGRCR